jgi:hypothetical protein
MRLGLSTPPLPGFSVKERPLDPYDFKEKSLLNWLPMEFLELA